MNIKSNEEIQQKLCKFNTYYNKLASLRNKCHLERPQHRNASWHKMGESTSNILPKKNGEKIDVESKSDVILNGFMVDLNGLHVTPS